MTEKNAEVWAEMRRLTLATPYEPMTPTPPLPEALAGMAKPDGMLDPRAVDALSLEDLARAYWLAYRYKEQAAPAFDEEIEWLEAALRAARSAKAETRYPHNHLSNNWTARRTPAPITWQSVRRLLKAGGLEQEASSRYARDQQEKDGTATYNTRKDSDTRICVMTNTKVALNAAQEMLVNAGYTVTHRTTRDESRPLAWNSIEIIKLKPGQTLADVEQPDVPPIPEGVFDAAPEL